MNALESSIKKQSLSIAICHGGCKDTKLESWESDYKSLVNILSTPYIGNKDGSYILRCTGTKRGNDTVADTASIIILDGDSRITGDGEALSGAPDPELVHKTLARLGLTHFIYSSYSNGATSKELAAQSIDSGGLYGADHHKYRAIIPCSYSREQLPAILDHLFNELHSDGVMLDNVKENRTWAQAWYLPRIPDQSRYDLFKFYEHVGSTIDADAIYKDWLKTNPKSICNPDYVEHLVDRISNGDARIVPSEHGTSISAYNDTHDLIETLESFGYIKKGKDRWLYPHSTSGVAGVLLCKNCKDGKLRFYSTHGNDPLNDGNPKDAFDIHMILGCNGDMKAALNWNPELTKQIQREYMQKQAKNTAQPLSRNDNVVPLADIYRPRKLKTMR